jgi:Spy/CpxP family protein refolding chaperone
MKLSILVSMLFCVALQYSFAQPGMQRGRAEERIETVRQVRMIEELGLDQDIAARIVAVNTELRTKNRELFREIEALTDELEQLISDDADEARLTELVDRIEHTRAGIHRNRQEAFTHYSRILTPEQLARLVVFERNFERDLRGLMRDAQRDRRRGF